MPAPGERLHRGDGTDDLHRLGRAAAPPGLLEVVNEDLFADALEDFFDEFHMQRMHLIIVLRLFARENEVERDLIRLVHDWAVAADHLADVELEHAGDGLEILVGAGDEFIRRAGLRRIRPKNDYVRKHAGGLSAPHSGTQVDSQQLTPPHPQPKGIRLRTGTASKIPKAPDRSCRFRV